MSTINTVPSLETRVAALEKQVELLLQRDKPSESGDWIRNFIRPVSDPEAFEEVIRVGREIREADRPKD